MSATSLGLGGREIAGTMLCQVPDDDGLELEQLHIGGIWARRGAERTRTWVTSLVAAIFRQAR